MRVKNEDARRFYENEAVSGQWSVRQLQRQVGSSLLAPMRLNMIYKPSPCSIIYGLKQINEETESIVNEWFRENASKYGYVFFGGVHMIWTATDVILASVNIGSSTPVFLLPVGTAEP